MSIEKILAGTDHAFGYAVAYVFAFIPAGIARWAWYADQIRRGRRKLALSLVLLEGVTALLCAYLGLGLADYLDWGLLSWKTAGVCAAISYLGPNGLFAIALDALRRRWPDPAPKEG